MAILTGSLSIDWRCRHTWRRSSVNTLWCLLGCSIGDHYASLEGVTGKQRYAYNIVRGHGIDGKRDGLILNNLMACFSHQRSIGNNKWASRFVNFVQHQVKVDCFQCHTSKPPPSFVLDRGSPRVSGSHGWLAQRI